MEKGKFSSLRVFDKSIHGDVLAILDALPRRSKVVELWDLVYQEVNSETDDDASGGQNQQ